MAKGTSMTRRSEGHASRRMQLRRIIRPVITLIAAAMIIPAIALVSSGPAVAATRAPAAVQPAIQPGTYKIGVNRLCLDVDSFGWSTCVQGDLNQRMTINSSTSGTYKIGTQGSCLDVSVKGGLWATCQQGDGNQKMTINPSTGGTYKIGTQGWCLDTTVDNWVTCQQGNPDQRVEITPSP
jgi:hypothetical protein